MTERWRHLRLAAVLLIVTAQSLAEREEPMAARDTLDMRRQAAAAIQAGDPHTALPLYRRLVADNPYDGTLWLGLAHCELQLGQSKEALAAFERTLETGAGVVAGPGFRWNVYLDMARVQARAGNREGFYQAVESALAARTNARGQLADDESLAPYRDEPRFKSLIGIPTKSIGSRRLQMAFDLDLFEDEAQRMYPRGSLPTAFIERVGALRRALGRLTEAEFAFGLMRAAAAMGNGHTSAYPTPASAVTLDSLPVQLYAFADGLYVVDAAEGARAWLGAEVLAFGEVDAGIALQRVAQLVPRDNPMGIKWIGPSMLSLTTVLHQLSLSESPDQATLTMRPVDGEPQTVTLVGGAQGMSRKLPVPGTGTALSYRNTELTYWFERIEGHPAIYWQYNQIREMPERPIAGFLRDLRAALLDDVRHLVLDLRRNNGGNSFLNRTVLRTLIHFEMSHPDNRVYVLQGRNTFSAAQNLVTSIYRLTNAVFVGEPSGSSPNHVGEDSSLVLPHTGISVASPHAIFRSPIPPTTGSGCRRTSLLS